MEKHRTVSMSLSPDVIDKIDDRTGLNQSKSNCIAFDLAVFWNVIERGLRELEQSFTRSEIELIKQAVDLKDANQSQIEMLLAGGLSLMVNDAVKNKDLASDHKVDGSGLIKKVDTMSDFARLACIDLCARIWRNEGKDFLEKFGA